MNGNSTDLKRTEPSVNLAGVDETEALSHCIGRNDFGQRDNRLS